MNKFTAIFTAFSCLIIITSCSGPKDGAPASSTKTNVDGVNPAYPMTQEMQRKEDMGKLFGDDGIFTKGAPSKDNSGKNISRGVNAYLWQSSLDVISFMPIATVDATGGVIITDWYEDPKVHGERLKANIVISSDELRASGVKVSLFRQVAGKGGWVNAEASADAARKLEDKILSRARELKIDDDRL